MSWHGYFGDAGGTIADLLGYGAQQQNADWFSRGCAQNQMAAAYNSQYNSQGISGLNSCWQGLPQQPVVKAPPQKADCEGCGAPLKAYIHHCEYCRRAAC